MCALESFSLESRKQDLYIPDAGVCMSGCMASVLVLHHREMCALLSPPLPLTPQLRGTFEKSLFMERGNLGTPG